jgi:NAD(P)-dependent dehydrogenase (short-subunit alcohol dehydrogenase family)
MTLDRRRVLVTGGGSGLGADLARGFAAAGAEVVVAGRRKAPLDAVAATADSIRSHVADVTNEADVVRLFDAFEPFDIVVANAGAAASARLTRTSLDLWRQMIDVNLTGVFLTLREGLQRMHGRDWGRLITIASIAGLKGYPYIGAYAASKHGAVGLTRAVAQEVAASGITANALCPGYLATELTERTIAGIVEATGRSEADATEALLQFNPQRRLIEPAEVTAAALWLCGPGSESINGQAIAIAGGEL